MEKAAGLEQKQIWTSFSRALGAELRQDKFVRGASGLEHRVQALAVDETQKRLIVISAEANPRISALMQIDVQSAYSGYNVIVARPIIFDIGVLAKRLFGEMSPKIPIEIINEHNIRMKELSQEEKNSEYQNYFNKVAEPVIRGWKNAKLTTASQVLDVANQAAQLDWESIGKSIKDGTTAEYIDLSSLYSIDTSENDRRYGICPIPLFDFTEADWDLLLSEGRDDELRARLRQLDVIQYFYPPPDQIALGLVDLGLKTEHAVIASVVQSPVIGHPLSTPEIVPTLPKFTEAVDALKASGHLVDGEYGLEVTPAGAIVRTSVRIRPKDSFLTKLLNRLNISISASPKDFLPR